MSVSSSADRDDVAILPRAAGSASQPGGKSPVRRGSVASPAANRRRFIEGILLLVCVNVIWVGASVLVQYIYKDLGFSSPFFVTYVSNSLFIVYLPAVPVYRYLAKRLCPARSPPATAYRNADSIDDAPPRVFTVKETAKVSLYICPVWFIAQCTYNASLDWTSVASSTILSTVSGLFTFILCLVFLKEQFRSWKLVGVFATIAGAVFVGWSDKEQPSDGSDTFGGDAIALFSAFCYAAYTTMIRKFIPDEHSVSMPLFFGFLGLFNSIGLLPLVIALKATGVETLDALTWKVFAFVCLKGLTDNVLSDLLWARAVLLTSPTIATIGLTLTIPLSMLSDLVFKHIAPTWLLIMGALCVTFGFIAVNMGGQLAPGDVAHADGASGGGEGQDVERARLWQQGHGRGSTSGDGSSGAHTSSDSGGASPGFGLAASPQRGPTSANGRAAHRDGERAYDEESAASSYSGRADNGSSAAGAQRTVKPRWQGEDSTL